MIYLYLILKKPTLTFYYVYMNNGQLNKPYAKILCTSDYLISLISYQMWSRLTFSRPIYDQVKSKIYRLLGNTI